MKRQLSLPFLVLSLLLIPAIARAQAWNGIIAPTRAMNWTNAGIPGGLPDASWTQCGSTIAAYGTSGSPGAPATIQNMINACGTDQYVLLGPGNFYLSSGLYLKSNMVLRGSGANQTFIYWPQYTANECTGLGGNICVSGAQTSAGGPFTTANWTADYTQGATTIVLSFPSWQASTAYSKSFLNSTVIEDGNGHLQAVYSAGTSGSSEPTCFTAGHGPCAPETTDGSMTWYDQGTVASWLPVVNLTPIVLDQCDTGFSGYTAAAGTSCGTGSAVDNNNMFVCQTAKICVVQGSASTDIRSNREQQEIVVATTITGAGPYTLTLSDPIENPNWASGQSPQAWWGSSPITNAGVEDLWMDNSDTGATAITLQNAYKCWVARVASHYANYLHIENWITSHDVVRDSYIYETDNAATESYGIGGISSGELLIENNISQQVADPVSYDAPCSGCVAAYNFGINNYYGVTAYQFGTLAFHAGGESYILGEGNIGSFADLDDIHGTHNLITLFRNYWNGYQANDGVLPTRNVTPVSFAAYTRYMNEIGDVNGTAGIFGTYSSAVTSTSESISPSFNTTINCLGWSGNTKCSLDNSVPPSPNDLRVQPTAMFWGNYNTVQNAVRWCGSSTDTGWSTTCGSASEIPTGDSYYPNSLPTVGDTGAGQGALPASFYNGVTATHPSCGTGLSFWKNPTTGTCPAYPPIGPDVTGGTILMCTSGTYKWSRVLNSSQCLSGSSAADSGHDYPIPAMICYLNQMGGAPDGTGSMLTFNAEACYTKDPVVAGSQPIAPTGIVATVQQ